MDFIVCPLDLKRVVLRSLSHEAEEDHAQVSCPTDEESNRECRCFIWVRGLVKESQLCSSVVDDLVFMVSQVSRKDFWGSKINDWRKIRFFWHLGKKVRSKMNDDNKDNVAYNILFFLIKLLIFLITIDPHVVLRNNIEVLCPLYSVSLNG